MHMSSHPTHCHALLSVAQMQAADAYAMAHVCTSQQLMERAGQGVADVILAHCTKRPVLVLAGQGNNGGDGFIAARYLAKKAWPVTVALLGDRNALQGDAAWASSQFKGSVVAMNPELIEPSHLIIDAIFGTGLTRPVDGMARTMLEAVVNAGCEVVAVDVPSGVHGDSGQVLGFAAPALHTVTFFCKKTGHVLLPGRLLCGEVHVVDIGIPEHRAIAPHVTASENHPDLWAAHFPWPHLAHHKYDRGHVVIAGGDATHTGAGRLAAVSALRMGAGLVTVACDRKSLPIYAAAAMSLMTAEVENERDFAELLEDERKNTVVIGPAAGVTEFTRRKVLLALEAGKRAVLDADALTSFANQPDELLTQLNPGCLLTPHEGEFARLFGPAGIDLRQDKLRRALAAASRCHAVILLKGADTVIAAPDGRAVINTHAPARLATAGAGDVLAGMCAGLIAQGMETFDAACAAVWLHGEAAMLKGDGLIADDLPAMLPSALQRLRTK